MINLPDQNLPSGKEEKVSTTLFYWIVGGLAGTMLAAFFYLMSRCDRVEDKYQLDHDKIIKIEAYQEIVKNRK